MKTLRQWKKLWDEGFSPRPKGNDEIGELFTDGKNNYNNQPGIKNHKLRAALRLLLIYIGDRNEDFTRKFSFPAIRKPKMVISNALFKVIGDGGKFGYYDEISVAYPANIQEVEDNKNSQLYSLTEYGFGPESPGHDTAVDGTPIKNFLQDGDLYTALILKYVNTIFDRIKEKYEKNGKTRFLELDFINLKEEVDRLVLSKGADFKKLLSRMIKFSPEFLAAKLVDSNNQIDPYVETIFKKDKLEYKVLFAGTATDITKSEYKFQALIRHKQIDDLLKPIATRLAKDNTPIYRNGDLHKILQIIKEETGKTIAVKYADFGIDHLAAIAKDIKDFIKPYKPSKSGYYWKRDLAKPFLGIYNLFKVLLTLLAVPLLFIRNFFELIFNTRSWEDAEDNLAILFVEPAEYLFDGLCLLLLAVTQMASLPVNFIKIPFRAVLTYFSEQRSFEDDPGFLQLERINNNKAFQHMDRKFEKHVKERGRSSEYGCDHKFFQSEPPNDKDTLSQGSSLEIR
jgi:hypothetical protein